MSDRAPAFGLIVVGDEILSGRRQDKHLGKVIELLAARGHALSWAHFVGDDPAALTALLRRVFDGGDIVFSCGGIGATPDDHTRQCAAAALGVALELHPEAQALIVDRMRELALSRNEAFDPQSPDQQRRLDMGRFPGGARIIPNAYNRIPGFSVADAHFVPGFPVMAHPMIEWVLDHHYAHLVPRPWAEHSLIVLGALEATLTPLMEAIEAEFSTVKVFSLPSVDHPTRGRHIELGVKGPPDDATAAYAVLQARLAAMPGVRLGT